MCLTTYTAGVLTLLASSALASHLSATAASLILSTIPFATLTPADPSSLTRPPLGTTGPTRPTSDLLEEEIEMLLDENRIGDIIQRLAELGELPGHGHGGQTSGEVGFDYVGHLGTGKSILADLTRGLNYGRDTNLNHGQEDWQNPNVLDRLLSRNQLECLRSSEDPNVLYTHIPNSTSCTDSKHIGLNEKQVCLDSIVRSLDLSVPSKTPTSHHNIPLDQPSISYPLLISALASMSELSLFEYFNYLPPLSNVSNFLFDTNDFDWNAHDRTEKIDTCYGEDCEWEEARYFQDIGRNGYRLMHEKIDLKFLG